MSLIGHNARCGVGEDCNWSFIWFSVSVSWSVVVLSVRPYIQPSVWAFVYLVLTVFLRNAFPYGVAFVLHLCLKWYCCWPGCTTCDFLFCVIYRPEDILSGGRQCIWPPWCRIHSTVNKSMEAIQKCILFSYIDRNNTHTARKHIRFCEVLMVSRHRTVPHRWELYTFLQMNHNTAGCSSNLTTAHMFTHRKW